MTDFSNIATRYERDSIVQRSASEILLGIADIKNKDDVLDLGCGTGHLTSLIRKRTNGAVVGVDQAAGMIDVAMNSYGADDILFVHCPAQRLDYVDRFDLIFCNSAFQWFTDPNPVLAGCYLALKSGGRIAVQAPARNNYSPNFTEAVEAVKEDPATGKTFAGFRIPWFFLETAEDYRILFEKHGFSVPFVRIEQVVTRHSAAEVYSIFESGASAGYLNQRFNEQEITEDYLAAFRRIVRESFERQADADGYVSLVFNRLYLVAQKNGNEFDRR